MKYRLRKYFYDELKEETFYEILENEYHFLSYCYGAYLSFCESESTIPFSQFLNNKLEIQLCSWHYVNKAHIKLKGRLVEQNISRREIRMLGYSGYQSVPRCPRSADIIQKELIKMVFEDQKFVKAFLNAVNDNLIVKYGNLETQDLNVLFEIFIGFQSIVLMKNAKSIELYNKLKNEFDYRIVGR